MGQHKINDAKQQIYIKQVYNQFEKAFADWKELAYDNGKDPRGANLQAFVKEYQDLFAKHFGTKVTSLQLLVMFGYLMANASAPELAVHNKEDIVRISANHGHVFSLSFNRMVTAYVDVIREETGKVQAPAPKIITVPKN